MWKHLEREFLQNEPLVTKALLLAARKGLASHPPSLRPLTCPFLSKSLLPFSFESQSLRSTPLRICVSQCSAEKQSNRVCVCARTHARVCVQKENTFCLF